MHMERCSQDSEQAPDSLPGKALLELLAEWEPLDEELPDVEDSGPTEEVNL